MVTKSQTAALPSGGGRAKRDVMTVLADKIANWEKSLERWPPAVLTSLALVVGFLLVVSRDPNMLLNAQFFGEDGWVWYPEAQTHGWASLLSPTSGYLNSFQRLVVVVCSTFLPLRVTPLVCNTVAVLVQVMPALLLLSPRGPAVIKPLWARLAFALIYLLLPNEAELVGHLVNAQWHLAVAAFLVLCMETPKGWLEVVGDAVILIASGLSGPFCLFLLPIALVLWFTRRNSIALAYVVLIVLSCMVQGIFIADMNHARSAAPLGASAEVLARILAMHIFAGAEFGGFIQNQLGFGLPWATMILVPVAMVAIMACAVVWGAKETPLPLLLFGIFAVAILVASLIKPSASLTEAQWPILQYAGSASRYFVFLMIAWIGVLFVLAGSENLNKRLLGKLLLALVVLVAIPLDWALPRQSDNGFYQRVAEFEKSSAGTSMEFAMPSGGKMVLVKQ